LCALAAKLPIVLRIICISVQQPSIWGRYSFSQPSTLTLKGIVVLRASDRDSLPRLAVAVQRGLG